MKGPYRAGWYRRVTDGETVVRKVVGDESGDGPRKAWLTCPFDVVQGGPCGGGEILTDEAWHAFEPAPVPRLAVN